MVRPRKASSEERRGAAGRSVTPAILPSRGPRRRGRKRKTPGASRPRAPLGSVARKSPLPDLAYVRGARPLGAVDHLEPDLVTLVEGPEPLCLDLAVVDEHVRPTFAGEETEALGLVEPLDRTFDHERIGLPSLAWRQLRARPPPRPPTVGGRGRRAPERRSPARAHASKCAFGPSRRFVRSPLRAGRQRPPRGASRGPRPCRSGPAEAVAGALCHL